jgi:hypothetical protein
MQAGPSPSSTGRRRLGWSWPSLVWLLFTALILVLMRLHAFDLPLETDECNYAYIGARLLAGDRLYVDVWDHQPFGVFLLFATVIGLFGDAPEAFRWMATGFSLVSLILVYAIARQCGGRAAGWIAAVLFALASSDPGTGGEGCNREIYMNTLILAAWYLAIGRENRGAWSLLSAGAALGLASTLKTVVAVHWLLLAAWLAVDAWRRADGETRGRAALAAVAWFAVAPAATWLGAFGYLALTDRFDAFVDAVFLFNLSYAGGSGGFVDRFVTFFSPPRHPFIFDSAMPLWIGGAVATAWLAYCAVFRRSRQSMALLLLLAAGFIAVCLPAQFWPHYYYLLIPALVIAVSVMVGRLCAWMRRRPRLHPIATTLGNLALFLLFPLLLFMAQYDAYLAQPLFGITVNRYNSRDFWGRAQGLNIRRVTKPGDEVFVYGNEAEFYYYSMRRCASRFTMLTGLGAAYSGHEKRRAILMDELEQRKPRLIVVLFDERPFDAWTAFLKEHYSEPIGWDFRDRPEGDCTDRKDPIMFVVERKDQSSVETIDWDWDRSAVDGWFPGEK